MDKYSLEEKEKIIGEYFEQDNILKKPLDGLERHNSVINDDIINNRKLICEILKIDGDDLIRLALARDGDCTCRSFAVDKDDIINFRDLALKVYPLEKYPVNE